MKYILYTIGLLSLYSCCKDPIKGPVIQSETIDYITQTQSTIDAGRLCLAELLAVALEDIRFRQFIKSMSINEEDNWNNELLLIELWDREIDLNITVQGLLHTTLVESGNSCFTTISDVYASILEDPLLVIKLPDIIDPRFWDEEEIIPVVYVNTIQPVSNSPGSSNGSYVGFHSSGFIDRYESETPKYFPLVLKWSDDFILFNRDLILYFGLAIDSYHDYDKSHGISEVIFDNEIVIDGQTLFFYKLNDLLRELNLAGDNIQQPYQLDTCVEQCAFDCIPDDQRKITAQEILIHSQNQHNSKLYEFSSVYRWNSQLILEDNVTSFIMTYHEDSGNGEWRKRLMGSFRLNSLFQIESSFNVDNQQYVLEDKLVTLPSLTLEFEVFDRLELPTASLVIANDIKSGDLLRFSSNRLKFDRLGNDINLLDGNIIWATKLVQDNLTNYDLYCIKMNDTLGFNSFGIVCDF